jgi:hypothetical protein
MSDTIKEYKVRWLPGYTKMIGLDKIEVGKVWCHRNLDKKSWSFTTDKYNKENVFHFENYIDKINFNSFMDGEV